MRKHVVRTHSSSSWQARLCVLLVDERQQLAAQVRLFAVAYSPAKTQQNKVTCPVLTARAALPQQAFQRACYQSAAASAARQCSSAG